MQHIIFDIDGTLTHSTGFDARCFKQAVLNHADVSFKSDWGDYRHVTDSGILDEILSDHDISDTEGKLKQTIKRDFVHLIDEHISNEPVSEVLGANDFLSALSSRPNTQLAIATGGWRETASLKLTAAKIDVEGIILCSANDAPSRVDIMRIALNKTNVTSTAPITYFGDASWDKLACSTLGWNFIAVGNRTPHHQQLDDYSNQQAIFELLDGNMTS